jgi:nitrite reductase (NADH) small subunit
VVPKARESTIWHRVGRRDEIPRRGARVVRISTRSIAIFRTSDDRVFALLDRCPHRGGPLSQGIVHGTCVTCPLHDWVIDLGTGEARGADEGATERFPVRIDGEGVELGVPAALPEPETETTPRCTSPDTTHASDEARVSAAR